ncbi:Vibrioferrin amide bond forming protein PvsD / Siderophore synthetase superfamily, group A [Edwardsiella anguillarum]|uniref:IucA/IucC family protein n=1 Tax=Edwardsiella anguillarum TaxID=1821960 RepID=UPI00045CF91B|nr:IucA/IucC family protein [Edwardsiella anguillarum]RFT01823.1 siderophore biosynthesis protein [Edwardsiella anguillarum]BET84425.1 Vibrioferrin amide bond forming protein PvsD / Siderophore synthetase superfamily, group A [Edwardsiella anguillarum]BET87791.1 Vibrioferrin amide bond forming protein PvsD / Siderophore synthetase superfamily, group A [Edwardsiella anguillarum]GAJ68671.1 vibrioferrin amide bond forming protein PvsD [Edwardsiella piscicida]
MTTDALTPNPEVTAVACHATFTALLNCYIREFALADDGVRLCPHGDIPQALTSAQVAGEPLRLTLPASDCLLAITARRWSLLGRGDFDTVPFVKSFGRPWRPLSSAQAIDLLLSEMAARLDVAHNEALAAQIANSSAVTAAFLSHDFRPGADFIGSEQGLIWGHPLHPSPKSRSGVDPKALLACSPEVGARFPLFWFRIDPRLLSQRGIDDIGGVLSELGGEPHLYPCHPWETAHIMRSPLYLRAARQGLITPLGPRGAALAPTSSVRTLYHPALPWFLKCSIHVRLTNCIRKNAWYELESAVTLSALLNEDFRQLEHAVPGLTILREPNATTLDFSPLARADEQEAVRHLQECFGILYRQALPLSVREEGQTALAGTLFGLDRDGASPLQRLIRELAATRALDYRETALLWLDHYLTLLLPSVLTAFFDRGIVFEPHLQNVLIGLQDHLPCRLWLRDLEGTKLDSARWDAARLATLSDAARRSVSYTRHQGWQRTAYCLFVNHLAEALFRLADGDRTLEQRLWDRLAHHLQRWRHQPEIAALLEGAPLPSKNNLRTRLLQRRDRHADYTPLPHPMRSRP